MNRFIPKKNNIYLLFLTLILLIGGSSSAQVVIWADSCQANTFNGRIQTASPNGLSEFTKILNYPNGDLICIGRIRTHTANALQGTIGLIMRIASNGTVVWSRFISYENLQGFYDMDLYEGIVTSSGDIVVTTDANLIKISGAGNIIWQRKLLEFPNYRSFQQMIETSDGGILAAGLMSPGAMVAKFDTQGVLQWSRTYYKEGITALNGITEANGAFYFIAKGWQGINTSDSTYNTLTRLNANDGTVSWMKVLGKTSNITRTEYTYDKIQFVNNELVVSGFTNYDYIGLNRPSQSIVTFSLAGDILEAKKIVQNDFITDRSLLFKKKRYHAKYNIGVQYSIFNNEGFCIYKKGQQNNIDWSVKYVSPSTMLISDIEITADSGIAIGGLSEYYTTNDNHAFLIKTSITGNLAGCPGTAIQLTVSDDNISTENMSLLSGPIMPPGNQFGLDLLCTPGTNFNFILSCTGGTAAKLGKITGTQQLCTGTMANYQVRREGSGFQPVQYSILPASAIISILSDSSVSINFPSAGRYILYASMTSACKVLKDSMIIDVLSAPGVLNLGSDISLCTKNSILVNARSGYSSYLWQDGSTDSTFMISSPGQYHVIVTSVCGGVYSDTVNVVEEITVFSKVRDRSKCNLDTIHMNGPGGFYNYSWLLQNGSQVSTLQNPVVNPFISTDYFLTAEKRPGCLIFDTAFVTVLSSPPINLGKDTGFCIANTLVLNAGNDYPVYTWNTGATNNSILVNTAGLYWLSAVYNNGCITRDTIRITQYPEPFVSLGNDTVLCKDVPRVLKTTGAFVTYQWQDGSVQNSYTANLPGNYTVIVKDSRGCTGSASIILKLSECTRGLFMPIAFTPNRDNLNDRIRPIIKGNVVRYRFLIINRYGEKVFESSDQQLGWDGSFKGMPQDNGAYIWVCEYQFSGQNKLTENGSLLLIR